MAFDNTKYDIELNNQPYRIRGYSRSEVPAFVPRVAAGSQSETEFNMLLSKTVTGFSAGSMQRKWDNDEAVFSIENLYPVYEDGILYPVASPTTMTIGTVRPFHPAVARSKDYIFIAWSNTSGGALQGITRYDAAGTAQAITVPASLQNSGSRPITDMVIWNNQLWVSGNNGSTGSMYYMDLASTTLTEITAGDAATFFQKMVVYKGQLYGTNVILTANYALSRYTGDTTTKSYAFVASTPQAFASYNARLFIFNNRITLTRNDGLFVFDGMQFATLDDRSQDVNENNYRYACVLNGYIYYWMPDGFYRFNGSLIEKLYDVTEIGFPTDMSVGKNRLWLTFVNSQTSGSSRYDRSMGYDYSSTNQYDGRVMCFNGKGLYTYTRVATASKAGLPLLNNEGELERTIWFADTLYVLTYADPSSTQYKINTNETAVTGDKSWKIVLSLFDANFAMVDKNLDNLEIVLDGVVSTNQSITIEYRTSGFAGSSGWATLGTFQTIAKLKEFIFSQTSTGIVFKRLQLRFSGTTDAKVGISKLVMRYTLSPDFKWQWQMTTINQGDDNTTPLQLADGTDGTIPVATLRGAIYAARDSDVPVKFVDVDQLDLNGAINSAVTSVVLNTTSLLKSTTGFIQIDDEVMYYTARTSTTLTVVRGALGTAAASHADNAKVFIVYRVLVSQIVSERIEMMDDQLDLAEDKSRQSETVLQLREV